MAQVLLAIAPAGSLFTNDDGSLTTGNYAPVPDMEIQTPIPIVYVRPGQFGFIGRTKNDFKVFPMHDNLESFRFEYLGWAGNLNFSIQLFDPEFDRLLNYFSAARTRTGEYSLYVRYGWQVDGTSGSKYSPTYETTVVGIQSTAVPGGMRLVVQAIPKDSVSIRTARIPFAVSIPEGVPPEQIAKYLIEFDYSAFVGVKSADELNALREKFEAPTVDEIRRASSRVKSTGTRLEIDPAAACEPVKNNGQPAIVVPAGSTVFGFIRDFLIPRAVPVNRNVPGAVYCYEVSPGVFRWSVFNKQAEVLRRYDVGRGSSHQVLSYSPSQEAWLANVLGGDGVVSGVDGAFPKGDQSVVGRQGTIAGPDNSRQDVAGTSLDTNSRFYRHSSDRTFETIVQKQRARWNQLKNVVFQADLTIVGDPGIKMLETIDIQVIAGGTTNTVGRYSESDSDQEPGTPSVVPYMSGLYSVLGFAHQIDMTGYQTTLHLTFQVAATNGELPGQPSQNTPPQSTPTPELVPTVSKPKILGRDRGGPRAMGGASAGGGFGGGFE
jgi:hypothetical protein